jgi:hypothetical protein
LDSLTKVGPGRRLRHPETVAVFDAAEKVAICEVGEVERYAPHEVTQIVATLPPPDRIGRCVGRRDHLFMSPGFSASVSNAKALADRDDDVIERFLHRHRGQVRLAVFRVRQNVVGQNKGIVSELRQQQR